MSELYHHGIPGQKWGVRNGPPYPLDERSQKHNAEVIRKKAIKLEKKYRPMAITDKYHTNAMKLMDNTPHQYSKYKTRMEENDENYKRVKDKNFSKLSEGYEEFKKMSDKEYQDFIMTLLPDDGEWYAHYPTKESTYGENINNEVVRKWMKTQPRYSSYVKEVDKATSNWLNNRNEISKDLVKDIIGNYDMKLNEIPGKYSTNKKVSDFIKTAALTKYNRTKYYQK